MKEEVATTLGSFLIKLGLFLQLYLQPSAETITVIVVLVIIDFITGNMKALKQGDKITSKLWRRSVGKFSAYMFAVLTSTIVEQYTKIPMISIIGWFIVSCEVKSVMENLSIVSGINLVDAIKDKLAALNSRESSMTSRENSMTSRETTITGRETDLSGRETSMLGREDVMQHRETTTTESTTIVKTPIKRKPKTKPKPKGPNV